MNEVLNQETKEQETVTQTGAEQVTQSEGTTTQEEVKTFTQDEVDKIIEERLARERKKFEDQLKEYAGSPMERELNKREREVARRELKIEARAILEERNKPIDILELIDYTDKESMEESLNRAVEVIDKAAQELINKHLRGHGVPKAPTGSNIVDNAIRKAFGLK